MSWPTGIVRLIFEAGTSTRMVVEGLVGAVATLPVLFIEEVSVR